MCSSDLPLVHCCTWPGRYPVKSVLTYAHTSCTTNYRHCDDTDSCQVGLFLATFKKGTGQPQQITNIAMTQTTVKSVLKLAHTSCSSYHRHCDDPDFCQVGPLTCTHIVLKLHTDIVTGLLEAESIPHRHCDLHRHSVQFHTYIVFQTSNH